MCVCVRMCNSLHVLSSDFFYVTCVIVCMVCEGWFRVFFTMFCFSRGVALLEFMIVWYIL